MEFILLIKICKEIYIYLILIITDIVPVRPNYCLAPSLAPRLAPSRAPHLVSHMDPRLNRRLRSTSYLASRLDPRLAPHPALEDR